MSRSDTEPDVIDITRPKYMLGREVSFSHERSGGEVLVGKIASSKQIVYGANYLVITYDINSSGTTFTNVPEGNIYNQSWPSKATKRLVTR